MEVRHPVLFKKSKSILRSHPSLNFHLTLIPLQTQQILSYQPHISFSSNNPINTAIMGFWGLSHCLYLNSPLNSDANVSQDQNRDYAAQVAPDGHDSLQPQADHEAKFSHEALAGTAAAFAFHEYETEQKKKGMCPFRIPLDE